MLDLYLCTGYCLVYFIYHYRFFMASCNTHSCVLNFIILYHPKIIIFLYHLHVDEHKFLIEVLKMQRIEATACPHPHPLKFWKNFLLFPIYFPYFNINFSYFLRCRGKWSSLKQLTKQPRTGWLWDEWEELSSSSPPFLTVNVFLLFLCVCSCVIKEFLLVLYALRMWCDVTYKKIMFCCFVVSTVVNDDDDDDDAFAYKFIRWWCHIHTLFVLLLLTMMMNRWISIF